MTATKSVAYRTLPLIRGRVALVDAADYPRVCMFKWSATKPKYQGGVELVYAHRTVKTATGQQYTVLLHRVIMDAPPGVQVDHIRRDRTLDCRRSNLRLSTPSQNQANRAKSNGTFVSVYKGVDRHSGKWRARLTVEGKQYHLGHFPSEEAAARAYNIAAVKYFGEFACLNKVGKGVTK